jgi:predicted tellurium resistance membrane protein TerC
MSAGSITAVYLVLFIVMIGYALWLEQMHDTYTPDYIWLTVVGGVALIGIAMLALCIGGALPIDAFWHLFGLSCTSGAVIIAWQLWQANKRKKEREKEWHS